MTGKHSTTELYPTSSGIFHLNLLNMTSLKTSLSTKTQLFKLFYLPFQYSYKPGRVRNFLPNKRERRRKKSYYAQLKQSLCFQLKPSPGHSGSLIWCFSSFHLTRAPLTFSVSFSIPKGQYHIEDTAPNVEQSTMLVKRISDKAEQITQPIGRMYIFLVSSTFFDACSP
jgi:hypothetical protein